MIPPYCPHAYLGLDALGGEGLPLLERLESAQVPRVLACAVAPEGRLDLDCGVAEGAVDQLPVVFQITANIDVVYEEAHVAVTGR